MRYTIEGFSQEKMVGLGLDCVDAVLLRWFVDFAASDRMDEIEEEGERLYWLKYSYIMDELPLMRIKDRSSLAARLKKLVAAGVLNHYCRKDSTGTRAYFGIGERFGELVSSTHPCRSKPTRGTGQNLHPVRVKTYVIDSDTTDSDTTDNISGTPSEPTAEPATTVPVRLPKPKKEDRDARIKHLIDYYATAFVEKKGFKPMVNGGTWGAIFKRLLKECDEETIMAVIDAFFEYDKRTKFSIYDFERSFDNVYGFLHEKQEAKK